MCSYILAMVCLHMHSYTHNNELITLLLNRSLARYMVKWSSHWTLNDVIILCLFFKCICSSALPFRGLFIYLLNCIYSVGMWGYVAKYSTNSIERDFVFSLNLCIPYWCWSNGQRSMRKIITIGILRYKIDYFLVRFWEDRITSTVQVGWAINMLKHDTKNECDRSVDNHISYQIS